MKNWLWMWLGLVSLSWGLEVSLQPEEISLDEVATFVISHQEALETLTLPEVEGITFQYQGMSQFSSLQILQGKTTMAKSFQYAYAVVPSRQGKFVIPSFEVRDKKKNVYHTDPLVLRVVGKRAQKKPSLARQTGEFVLPRLFYVLEPKKTVATQNEGVILTGYIVSDQREALFYSFQQIRPIMADNCVLYDGTAFLSSEVMKRRDFWYRPLHQWVLFGVEAGALPIAPPQMIAVSPVGQLSVPTENIVLDIRRSPLFSYHGWLEGGATLSSLVVTQGMTLEYVVTLRGNGNLTLFSDVLHGVTLSHVSLSPVKVEHFLTNWKKQPEFFQRLSYQLTPLEAGSYEIPSITLRYQSERGEERKLILPSYRLEVVPKEKEKEVFLPLVKREKMMIGYVGGSIVFWFILIVVVGFPWGFVLWTHYVRKMQEDPSYARYVRSLTKSTEYFQEAEVYLKKGEGREFARVFLKAVVDFITDREKLSRNIRREDLLQELQKKGWNDKEYKALLGIFHALETIAYAPMTSCDHMQEVYEKTSQLLKSHYGFW